MEVSGYTPSQFKVKNLPGLHKIITRGWTLTDLMPDKYEKMVVELRGRGEGVLRDFSTRFGSDALFIAWLKDDS